MTAKRYTIRVNSETTGTTINIPINLKFTPVDQSELIEKEFVEKETEKAINPIIDWEKARYIPVENGNTNQVPEVIYNLTFKGGGTTYGSIGFIYDDVKFLKNKFKQSFLRLNFYDSDITTNQNLLFYITIFAQLTLQDHKVTTPGNTYGQPLPVNSLPIRFRLSDPITIPSGFAEGYFIHYLKSAAQIANSKEVFMRASFSNAKDGKTTNLMTSTVALPVDQLVNNLHTKYVLKRDIDGFYYEIDATAPNVSYTSGTYTINLYEIDTI